MTGSHRHVTLDMVNESPLTAKTEWKRRGFRVLIICVAMYILAFLGCASFQRKLIYFPPHLTRVEMAQRASSEGLERWSGTENQPLGWKRLSKDRPLAGRMLIMHGNACCAFECGHYADSIQQAGAFDVFLIEFPGYGECPGKPSEATLEQAAAKGLRSLETNAPIYLVGESLGTGVAAWLAGQFPNQIAGVVLLAPYNRLTDVAQAHIRIFPVSWILCDRYPSDDYLARYHGPLAVLVGGQDSVIPKRIGLRLFQGYLGPKRLWTFPEATHDSLMIQSAETWKEIVAFWQTNAGNTSSPPTR